MSCRRQRCTITACSFREKGRNGIMADIRPASGNCKMVSVRSQDPSQLHIVTPKCNFIALKSCGCSCSSTIRDNNLARESVPSVAVELFVELFFQNSETIESRALLVNIQMMLEQSIFF